LIPFVPGTKGIKYVASMETVLQCSDLDAMVAFFHDELGFAIRTISPADDPAEIEMSLEGAHIRLRRSPANIAGHLIVPTDRLAAGAQPEILDAPNGTVVELVSSSLDVVVPDADQSLSIVTMGETGEFGVGRAGMEYRDLLPNRWGGRFIASHIRIEDGGDVADYVHFHRIRFQMIFVAAGWVEVVYEDQGEPFRMEAGDCVLQPPEIRHRVLRSSPGLEVIEIGCPAVHDTVVEQTIALPTSTIDRERNFGGQRFVRHVAAEAAVVESVVAGLSERDTGIEAATDGLAGARVLAATAPSGDAPQTLTHDGEIAIAVVLAGSASLQVNGDSESRSEVLTARDAIAFPSGAEWVWSSWSDNFEVLDVTLPARTVRRT
jgi:quercetin dioxygenase-like cupin family protein